MIDGQIMKVIHQVCQKSKEVKPQTQKGSNILGTIQFLLKYANTMSIFLSSLIHIKSDKKNNEPNIIMNNQVN